MTGTLRAARPYGSAYNTFARAVAFVAAQLKTVGRRAVNSHPFGDRVP